MKKTSSLLSMFFLGLALVGSTSAGAQSERCQVTDTKRYYKHDDTKKYKVYREAEAIARALFEGPLMREDIEGTASLRRLLMSERETDIRRLQGIVRSHLYGDSEEFRDLLKALSEKYGPREASQRIVDSIYKSLGQGEVSEADRVLDACLVRNRQAHLVATRVIVNYLERRKLG